MTHLNGLEVNNLMGRADRLKIIYCGTDPAQIRKWRYRKATIREEL